MITPILKLSSKTQEQMLLSQNRCSNQKYPVPSTRSARAGVPMLLRFPREPHSSLEGKRVLLVEDNQLNREIAAELLTMHDFIVDTVEKRRLAVEKFKVLPSGTYDCILMDIQMPVMDGYQAAEALRALDHEDARTVPILALTAQRLCFGYWKGAQRWHERPCGKAHRGRSAVGNFAKSGSDNPFIVDQVCTPLSNGRQILGS